MCVIRERTREQSMNRIEDHVHLVDSDCIKQEILYLQKSRLENCRKIESFVVITSTCNQMYNSFVSHNDILL